MKQKITVSDDEDTNYLALALEAKTDAARKYITDHAQEYTEFEGFVGVKQATVVRNLLSKTAHYSLTLQRRVLHDRIYRYAIERTRHYHSFILTTVPLRRPTKDS